MDFRRREILVTLPVRRDGPRERDRTGERPAAPAAAPAAKTAATPISGTLREHVECGS